MQMQKGMLKFDSSVDSMFCQHLLMMNRVCVSRRERERECVCVCVYVCVCVCVCVSLSFRTLAVNSVSDFFLPTCGTELIQQESSS